MLQQNKQRDKSPRHVHRVNFHQHQKNLLLLVRNIRNIGCNLGEDTAKIPKESSDSGIPRHQTRGKLGCYSGWVASASWVDYLLLMRGGGIRGLETLVKSPTTPGAESSNCLDCGVTDMRNSKDEKSACGNIQNKLCSKVQNKVPLRKKKIQWTLNCNKDISMN